VYPTAEQITDMIHATQNGCRAHGWDRDPGLLALYLDPDDPAAPLRWSLVPVPASTWRTDDPDTVMRTMAKSLATPEAVYCLSVEAGWARWCGLLFAVEIWEIDCDTSDPDVIAATVERAQSTEGHPDRVQSRVVAAIYYPGPDNDDAPHLACTSWRDGADLRWLWDGPGPYDADTMGVLADSLYLIGASMRDLRRTVLNTGIAPTASVHEHHQHELGATVGH
jgi:hypothetical protein